jgi:hypothetical protein
MFAAEGMKLEQRTVPTFKAMLADIREAERAGACVYAVDSLTIIWQKLMQSFKAKNGGRIPINVWADIKAMWGQYTTRFLNSPMHSFALGRLGNVMEEVEGDKPGDSKLVKTGTPSKSAVPSPSATSRTHSSSSRSSTKPSGRPESSTKAKAA